LIISATGMMSLSDQRVAGFVASSA
jgi:hypothetical protein